MVVVDGISIKIQIWDTVINLRVFRLDKNRLGPSLGHTIKMLLGLYSSMI